MNARLFPIVLGAAICLTLVATASAAPIVIDQSPPPNANATATSTAISVDFDIPMDPATATDFSIIVLGASTGRHPGSITYNGDFNRFTFTPTTAFEAGELVTVTLTTAITDAAGNPIDAPFSWQFRVETGGYGTLVYDVFYSTGPYPLDLTFGDFDGDGDPDVATANRDLAEQGVTILLNNGDATFTLAGHLVTGPQAESIASGDFNGDGILDLAVANYGDSTVSRWLGVGDGSFDNPAHYPAVESPRDITTADLNGDGLSDIIAACAFGPAVAVYMSSGNGNFQPGEYYFQSGGQCTRVCAGDFNNDGYIDVANTRLGENGFLIRFNQGNGILGDSTTIPLGEISTSPTGLCTADFDGDGDLDLAAGDTWYNWVWILYNGGDGITWDTATVPDQISPQRVEAADFNGDTHIDVAAVFWSGTDRAVLYDNDGLGGFTAGDSTAAGGNPNGLAIADFDLDGDLDAVVACYNANSVKVLLNEYTGCCVLRGDVNGSGGVNISDVTYLIDMLFRGGPDPECWDHGNVNADSENSINIADATYLIDMLFRGGPDPAPCP